MATEHDAPLRLALIGLGNQGHEHLLGMARSEHTRFVAAVDSCARAREQISKEYPQLQLFAETEELAAQAAALRLDGLVLCLPHHRYAEDWEKIAGMELPVLKEKPLARTLDEARTFRGQLSHAPQSRSPLKTAIQRRHHESYVSLKEILDKDKIRIREAHAWLHLGRIPDSDDHSWRSSREQAGGGILLDAGYHLIDLIHFYVGPVEAIHCATTTGGRPSGPDEIETEARLLARNSETWVMVDARLGGEVDAEGKPQKSEGIRLLTDQGTFFANRSAVYKDGKKLRSYQRDWQQAMARQLDEFATDIREQRWDQSSHWDQLPAMQLIETAYQLARRF